MTKREQEAQARLMLARSFVRGVLDATATRPAPPTLVQCECVMHTPGTWEAHQEKHGLFVSAGSFCIARLGDGAGETQHANAKLIAAAPDLLAFAQWCVSERFDSRDLGSAARAAIAKAQG
jgi:hypothetical protein